MLTVILFIVLIAISIFLLRIKVEEWEQISRDAEEEK